MTNLKIKIDPELSTLFKNLQGWDYDELKKDIEVNGVRIPIEVAEDGTLIEGHQRVRIWNDLGRDPADIPMNVKHYESREEMKDAAITLNILRRHLNNAQRAWIALRHYLPEEKEKAKERMLKGKEDPGEIFPEGSGKSYSRAAKKVGLSGKTLRKAEKVFKEATTEVVENVLKGKTSLSHASTKVKRKEKHDHPPELPKGEYDVILADPPWQYDFPLRGNPDEHYSTMTNKAIYEQEIPAAKQAVLFLWVTNPKLPAAIKTITAWGFKYKTNMVWVKDKWGTGYYFRGQHELLLVATKGDIPPPTEETRFSSVLEALRGKHSEKPEDVYERIEKMYPNRNYLELFARNNREGWTSWGLEVDS